MLPTRYLRGVRYGETFMDGVYTVDDYRGAHSIRCVGSYEDLRASKLRIFHLAYRVSRQRENPAEWQAHHVVERMHLADVDFLGTLSAVYETELPCVLIHNHTEHKSYTSTLGSREATELFRSPLPRRMADRSARAQRLFQDSRGRATLRGQVERLVDLYANHYDGDAALQTIARNVLRDLIPRLT